MPIAVYGHATILKADEKPSLVVAAAAEDAFASSSLEAQQLMKQRSSYASVADDLIELDQYLGCVEEKMGVLGIDSGEKDRPIEGDATTRRRWVDEKWMKRKKRRKKKKGLQRLVLLLREQTTVKKRWPCVKCRSVWKGN